MCALMFAALVTKSIEAGSSCKFQCKANSLHQHIITKNDNNEALILQPGLKGLREKGKY